MYFLGSLIGHPTQYNSTMPADLTQGGKVIELNADNARSLWTSSLFTHLGNGTEGSAATGGGGRDNGHLRVGGWGDEYVSLIWFKIERIPCSSHLALLMYAAKDDGTPTPFQVYEINEPWKWTPGSWPWWKGLPDATRRSQHTFPAPRPDSWVKIDISETFHRWCREEFANHGLMLRPILRNNNFTNFYGVSSDNLALRPKLLVMD